jgi:hypothetical protein
MVAVSHKYKFIALRNFKVASTSTENFFGQFCIDPSLKHMYSFKQEHYETIVSSYGIVGRISQVEPKDVQRYKLYTIHPGEPFGTYSVHASANYIKQTLGDDIFNEYTKFCVIRNPYDRMVSMYYWNVREQKHVNFKDYCNKIVEITNTNEELKNHWNNTSRLLLDGKPVCDFYIRYEHLKEDIITLLDKLGITDYDIDQLPYHKSGVRPKGKHYREYYDDETREIVYNLYKTEFDMFGYTF